MMIGEFHTTQDGFAGRIRSLTLDAAVTLVPARANDSENAPDWRVLLGDADTGIEIGAGWNRTGERAGAYVSVHIDDPAFVLPLRGNLLRSIGQHDVHHLLWSRPTHRDRK